MFCIDYNAMSLKIIAMVIELSLKPWYLIKKQAIPFNKLVCSKLKKVEKHCPRGWEHIMCPE